MKDAKQISDMQKYWFATERESCLFQSSAWHPPVGAMRMKWGWIFQHHNDPRQIARAMRELQKAFQGAGVI